MDARNDSATEEKNASPYVITSPSKKEQSDTTRPGTTFHLHLDQGVPLSTVGEMSKGMTLRLGDQGGSSGGLVLEGRGQLLLLDVVSGETVDPGLDQNETAVDTRTKT